MNKKIIPSFGILLSFFLPWLNILIFNINGYEIPGSFNNFNQIKELFSETTFKMLSVFSYTIFLIPCLSIYNIFNIYKNVKSYVLYEYLFAIVFNFALILFLHKYAQGIENIIKFIGAGYYLFTLSTILGLIMSLKTVDFKKFEIQNTIRFFLKRNKEFILFLIFFILSLYFVFSYISLPTIFNLPEDAIKGDFNGDGEVEFAWIEPAKIDETEMNCENNKCESILRFSNDIEEVILPNCIGGVLENLGDLNNDNTSEIGFYPDWFQGYWKNYIVYRFKNESMGLLVDPIPTYVEQRQENITPIQKDPNNINNVIITYTNEKDFKVITKSVKMK